MAVTVGSGALAAAVASAVVSAQGVDALATVARVVYQGGALSVHGGGPFSDTRISTAVPGAQSDLLAEGIDVVVHGPDLRAITRLAAGRGSISLEQSDGKLTLRSGVQEWKLTPVAHEHVPAPEILERPGHTAGMPPEFAALLKLVEPARGNETIRPVLMGVLVQVADGKVEAVATDSYRLIFGSVEMANDQRLAAVDWLLPPTACQQIAALSAGDLWVAAESSVLLVGDQATVVEAKLLPADLYPSWRAVAEKGTDSSGKSSTFGSSDLASGIEAVSLVASGDSQPVRMEWANEALLVLSASRGGEASGTAEVPCSQSSFQAGDKFCVSSQQLQLVLRAVGGDGDRRVRVARNEPFVWLSAEDSSVDAIIMEMKVS